MLIHQKALSRRAHLVAGDTHDGLGGVRVVHRLTQELGELASAQSPQG